MLEEAGARGRAAVPAVVDYGLGRPGPGQGTQGTYARCSDEDLVARTRAGEYAAFDELVARHRDGLYTLAVRTLGDEAEAGDALCEMVLAAFHGIESRSANCSPGAWLWLHGLRAVLGRLNPQPRGYTIVPHPEVNAAP